jgi:hypothetical protein
MSSQTSTDQDADAQPNDDFKRGPMEGNDDLDESDQDEIPAHYDATFRGREFGVCATSDAEARAKVISRYKDRVPNVGEPTEDMVSEVELTEVRIKSIAYGDPTTLNEGDLEEQGITVHADSMKIGNGDPYVAVLIREGSEGGAPAETKPIILGTGYTTYKDIAYGIQVAANSGIPERPEMYFDRADIFGIEASAEFDSYEKRYE